MKIGILGSSGFIGKNMEFLKNKKFKFLLFHLIKNIKNLGKKIFKN